MKSITIATSEQVIEIRVTLRRTAERARRVLAEIASDPHALSRLKFERLGCDPVDEGDDQNLAEQIDQQATCEVAIDALEEMMRRHPRKSWEFAPGAHGSGHDIVSTDGEVAVEVFAAVSPKNNGKLKNDISKLRTFKGKHRYVFFRSPLATAKERIEQGVTIVSLGT